MKKQMIEKRMPCILKRLRKAWNEGKGFEMIYKFKILFFSLENFYPSQTLHTNP